MSDNVHIMGVCVCLCVSVYMCVRHKTTSPVWSCMSDTRLQELRWHLTLQIYPSTQEPSAHYSNSQEHTTPMRINTEMLSQLLTKRLQMGCARRVLWLQYQSYQKRFWQIGPLSPGATNSAPSFFTTADYARQPLWWSCWSHKQ